MRRLSPRQRRVLMRAAPKAHAPAGAPKRASLWRRVLRRLLARCAACGAAADLYCIECQARLCRAHADDPCPCGPAGVHVAEAAEGF